MMPAVVTLYPRIPLQ